MSPYDVCIRELSKYVMITREQFGDWRDDAKAQTVLCEQGGLSSGDLKTLLGN
jgi:hypothetical protein